MLVAGPPQIPATNTTMTPYSAPSGTDISEESLQFDTQSIRPGSGPAGRRERTNRSPRTPHLSAFRVRVAPAGRRRRPRFASAFSRRYFDQNTMPTPTPNHAGVHATVPVAEQPLITLDADGRVVSANAAFRAAVGAEAGIAVGAIAPRAWWPTWETERDRLLRRVAEVVAVEGDPSAVLTLVAEVVATAFGADGGRVARFRGDVAEVVGAWGVGADVGQRFSLSGRRTLALVAATGRPARVDDYRTLRREDPDSARTVHPVYRSGIAAPIRWGGMLWGGLLALSTREDTAFAPGSENRLAELGELVGMAVAGAAARAEERAGVTSDLLTGLLNRRTFEEHLAVEVERAHRHERQVSLVLFDVDGFGELNDRIGHAGGDEILKAVAARIRSCARAGSAVARLGADEFGWILPDTDADGAAAAAARARREISATPFGTAGHLTVSAGVCDLRRAPDGPRDLQRKAHIALYAAQHGSRDDVVRYAPEIVEVVSTHEQARRIARGRALSGIRLLARAVDARDPSTQRHSERVAALAHELGLGLGWPREEALLLHQAGLVHDVGKIGVPDSVLLKPGPLTACRSTRPSARRSSPRRLGRNRWSGSGTTMSAPTAGGTRTASAVRSCRWARASWPSPTRSTR